LKLAAAFKNNCRSKQKRNDAMRKTLIPAIGLSLLVSALHASAAAGLSTEHATFGKMPDGTTVEKYTLRNSLGMQATVITYGGTLQSLLIPDKHGKTEDVVLGFDDLEGYLKGTSYFGATIGRFGNRLADGKFTLDGKTYQVPQNDKTNALHGGTKGFDKQVWKAEQVKDKGWVGVKLTYVSADEEMGFPGTLKSEVTYSLNEKN